MAEPAGIACFATQGSDHGDAERLRGLLAPLQPREYPFDRAHRLRSALQVVRLARRERPSLIVMEGTGIAGGVALLAIRALHKIPFVVSSGDAVGPYLGLRSAAAGVAGAAYERALCHRCAGFIGWTPYLAGRALTLGAPRAMTAAGWSHVSVDGGSRSRVRERLGIPADAIVLGFAGSLRASRRRRHVYGAELVEAVAGLRRRDVVACILGDGPGLDHLRQLAGDDLDKRVFLPGRVGSGQIGEHLASFDLASLSQSVDRVGSFRYTIKMSEYAAAGLPVVTCQTPAAYDLDDEQLWHLPGAAPWDPVYIASLQRLLEALRPEELERRRDAARRATVNRPTGPFAQAAQQRRVQGFIEDLLVAAAR